MKTTIEYVAVSPNPTTGIVDIPYGFLSYDKVEVLNQMGQTILVVERRQEQIDVSDLIAGIYYIRFRAENSQDVYAKFLKVD